MFKKFLVGALAAVLTIQGAAINTTTASAASVPKAKYTFDMNKANKNVVAVARKGDTTDYKAANLETGVLPKEADAKKIKLKYVKGHNGKALHLDRSSSYGAQLKNVKLGSGSWTVSFWLKADSAMSDYMSVFFTGSDIVTPEKTKWISLTKASWLGDASPTIWSHNANYKGKDEFPWFSNVDWAEGNEIVPDKKWQMITLVVDTKDTCEYGTEGEDGYVKSYHAWTYVNGKPYGNGTVAHNTMSNKNLFFLGINAWDTPFKGAYDDVMFWNKALTEKQVAALYKSQK